MDDVRVEVTPAKQTDFTVTDKRGRVFTLRKPPFIAQFDLIDALGVSASNETYRSMVTPLLYVAAIDGESVSRPTTKSQLRALAQRLDEDGFVAVGEGIQQYFVEPAAAEEEQALKNA
jgi:hypothetical protein